MALGQALNQAVEAKFAHIVAELGKSVILGFEVIGVQESFVKPGSGPFAKMASRSLHQ